MFEIGKGLYLQMEGRGEEGLVWGEYLEGLLGGVLGRGVREDLIGVMEVYPV